MAPIAMISAISTTPMSPEKSERTMPVIGVARHDRQHDEQARAGQHAHRNSVECRESHLASRDEGTSSGPFVGGQDGRVVRIRHQRIVTGIECSARTCGEEVVALVVDDDEGGEVLDLDPPDRLHAELGVLEHLDLADAVLGARRAAGPPIEPR